MPMVDLSTCPLRICGWILGRRRMCQIRDKKGRAEQWRNLTVLLYFYILSFTKVIKYNVTMK